MIIEKNSKNLLKMIKILILILFMFFTSCSSNKTKKIKESMENGSEHFLYTDKNGKFKSTFTYGFKEKEYFTKRTIEIPGKEKDGILEQSIVFSNLGSVKGKNILRPKVSQYTVWFDGKKYFSELKINPKKKAFELKMVSPESNWNGTKEIKFPTTKANICFFSQLVECVKLSGFLDAKKNAKKTMSLYLVWEGYPYLNETYTDFPSELFSKAIIEIDSTTKNEEKKFNVQVAGQSIFYVVNKDNQFKKMFWVSQGISMLEKNEVQKPENQEDAEVE